MGDRTAASERVAMNTFILYLKTLLTICVSLYSTRIVLSSLGVSDYGIFNLIAGVITMLSFLNAAMASATQRFLSFYHGKENFSVRKKVFINSWVLHLVLGVLVVFFLLVLSQFLFDGFLNIPSERVPIAKTVYLYMAVAVFFTIVSVPFTALLNAHENMLWIAIVNILEAIMKLLIAISLNYFIASQRLAYYGLFMAGVTFISFLLYALYTLKKYDECTILNYKYDKLLMKNLGSFAGWNLFGSACVVGRNQGIAIVLNVFFGTIVSAAYGIANQVAGQLVFFSATLLKAINPQIMKSEGVSDRKRMLKLSMMASKLGFFLVSFIAIPAIFEMPSILRLWLKDVPEYTVAFCSLYLITTLINQTTIGLQSAIQATGKIRAYQLVIGGVVLMNVPISYILLKQGLPPHSVLVCAVFIESLACAFRIYFLKVQANLSIRLYVDRVFSKEIIPTIVILSVCLIITTLFDFDLRLLITFPVSIIAFFISVYYTGFCDDEKQLVTNMLHKILKK